MVNELILQGQAVQPSILVAQAKDTKEYDTVVISKAADTMLAMSGIEASFVIAKTAKGIFPFLQEVEVRSMCNGLWKNWVVEATSTWQLLDLQI